MVSKKVYIKTYGCQMNVHETEKMYADFEKHGYLISENIEKSDIIIYNTCCVREGAETKVIGNLGIAKKLKENNRNLIIAVCGCMTQQEGMVEYLHARCPFINVITGTYGTGKIVKLIEDAGQGYVANTEIDEHIECGVNESRRSNVVNNYVNVMYGCNNFCTYCIVPYVKGRERSRRLIDIKLEVQQLIGLGAKEITLLGQNVNSYLDEDGKDFYSLLCELAGLDGDFWIKFLTSHPKDLSKSVIKLIGEEDKLAKCIHLPLQSGSDRILSDMNRKYTLSEYLQKIEWVKSYIPEVAITSDIVIGFPGETEDDFRSTLDAVSSVKYSNLFMFLYSKRKGTPAAEMRNQIAESVKKERISQLISVQSKIENELANNYVGKTIRVLCDAEKHGKISAKSSNDKPVILQNGTVDMLNKFYNVSIDRVIGSKLYGNIKE